MGSNTIGATGVGLPSPLPLYPVTIQNLPGLVATNRISLPPGGNLLIPAGTWEINDGTYSSIQVLDPVANIWTPWTSTAGNLGEYGVNADGVNYRIINPTGFPIGAIVNSSGSGYTTAPTVTASASGGGSTWLALVGGAVSQLNVATAGSGTNYAVPPIINIAAPPSPGVQATAVCTISGGALATFTIINAGAGYTSAPAVTVVPQASDTNFFPTAASTTNVVNATVTSQLSYVGMISAVLLTNEGTAVLTAPSQLAFSGGNGSGAAATMVCALTITGLTVTTPGSGFGSAGNFFMTAGGTVTSAQSVPVNPAIGTQLLVPRQVTFAATAGSGAGSIGALPMSNVQDTGLFSTAPTLINLPGPTGASSALSVVTPTMGGTNDTCFITPL